MAHNTRSRRIALVNESSVFSETEAVEMAWGLNYQANWQLGPAWGILAEVSYFPVGIVLPRNIFGVIHLLDVADQQGALGYHDEDGAEVPFSRVFAKTTLEAGGHISEVGSHEMGEMLIDPHIADASLSEDGRFFAKEVGDPCQGNAYDVGAPDRHETGIVVADFALPPWFDSKTGDAVATDYMGALRGPFAVGPQGYCSFIDLADPSAGWQQTLGQERDKAPVDLDDRLARRIG